MRCCARSGLTSSISSWLTFSWPFHVGAPKVKLKHAPPEPQNREVSKRSKLPSTTSRENSQAAPACGMASRLPESLFMASRSASVMSSGYMSTSSLGLSVPPGANLPQNQVPQDGCLASGLPALAASAAAWDSAEELTRVHASASPSTSMAPPATAAACAPATAPRTASKKRAKASAQVMPRSFSAADGEANFTATVKPSRSSNERPPLRVTITEGSRGDVVPPPSWPCESVRRAERPFSSMTS
mmetsp:Transcript_158066/g.507061  ORF Transcript_158066/g.507061 Transcript_158066/m.507061 type:complete len:244 (-) Transcript_158066:561-1292(-)